MDFLPPLPMNREAARRDLHSKNAVQRAAAAARLSEVPLEDSDQVTESLAKLLDDESPAVREAVIASLGKLGARTYAERIGRAISDDSPAVRQIAVMALGDLGGEVAEDWLNRALRNGRPEVRFQAVTSLAKLAPPDANAQIVAVLSDDDPQVRFAAAEALSLIGTDNETAPLVKLLLDSDPDVKLQAAISLSSLGNDQGADALASGLTHSLRALDCALALREVGNESHIPALQGAANRRFASKHLKAAAGAALYRLGDMGGADAVLRVLKARRGDARDFAIQLIGEEKICELLTNLLQLRKRDFDRRNQLDAAWELRDCSTGDARAFVASVSKRADDPLNEYAQALMDVTEMDLTQDAHLET